MNQKEYNETWQWRTDDSMTPIIPCATTQHLMNIQMLEKKGRSNHAHGEHVPRERGNGIANLLSIAWTMEWSTEACANLGSIWGHDQYLGYSEGLSPWIYLTFVREPAFKCAGWLHRVSDRSVPASESPSTLRIEILTPVIYRSVNHRSILAFLVEKEFKINLLVSAYDHQGEERETGRLTKRSMELFTLSKRRLLPDDTWQTFRRCRTQFGKGKYL